MKYEKPEVAVLGEAASLILGNGKANDGENGLQQIVADCEVDD